MVKTATKETVYYVNRDGYKKAILNLAVFNSYGHKWENVKTISAAELVAYPSVRTISLAGGDGSIYLLNGASKQLIQHPGTFNQAGVDLARTAPVNQADFDSYQVGAPIP